MKIKNNNSYKIMYGLNFIGPNEVIETEDKKVIDLLLKQPNVVEYVDKEDLTAIEEENKKLKEELKKAKNEVKNETKAKAKK